MPRVGITAYDVLISCPSDVHDYLEVIHESIDSFNKLFGALNNIHIATKHWSTDSYPESGDKPQELLNKQLVHTCDAAIAIFWTKFGTPTDKHGSGTEEEIEEMLSAGKQVFMYFIDAPINPSNIDMEQYKKVQDFKQRYKDKGLYALVEDKQSLKRELTNHLSMHFIPLISKNNPGIMIKTERPILKIQDINDISGNTFSLITTNLCEGKFATGKRNIIVEEINSLQSMILPSRTQTANIKNEIPDTDDKILGNEGMQKLLELTKKFAPEVRDAEIPERWKTVINGFAIENGLTLEPDFWNIGDLQISTPQISMSLAGYNAPTLKGSEDETARYEKLKAVYLDVVIHNEYREYFAYIDKLSLAKMTVANLGTTFDEDIDIKLTIPKGRLFKYSQLILPGITIIKELIDMNFVDCVFKIREDDNIDGYGYYPPQLSYPDLEIIHPFNNRSASEEYEKNKRKYKAAMDNAFIYKVFETENDILVFHIGYLKHNTRMAFPSVLMFEKAPDKIEYEISSKHSPEIVKGIIEFRS